MNADKNQCPCGYVLTKEDFEESTANSVTCPKCLREDERCQYCNINLPVIDDRGLCICQDCFDSKAHIPKGGVRNCTDEVEIDDLELENDTVIAVQFDRSWNVVRDSDYGADANGNRGGPVDFIEDDKFHSVTVNCSRNPEKKRWIEITKLRKANQNRIECALTGWTQKNAPPFQDPQGGNE